MGPAGAAVTIDADQCSATWALAAGRRFGEASVWVPRDSRAHRADYLDDEGGFLVRLDDAVAGPWTGVADAPRTDARGSTVTARHLAALTADVVVRSAATYRNATAGALAHAACRLALTGHPLLRPGTFTEAAPAVPECGFAHRSLADLLGDLVEQTGQEWRVSEDGALDWTPPTGRLLEVHLSDGTQVVDATRETDGAARVAEVIARGPAGAEFAASTGEDCGLWRGQTVVSVGSDHVVRLGAAAWAQLLRRRAVLVTYRLGLLTGGDTSGGGGARTDGWGRQAWGTSPWGGAYLVAATTTIGNVREGDTLLLHLPALHPAGRTAAARVVARTVTAGSPYTALELTATLPPPASLAARSASVVAAWPADGAARRLVDAGRALA